MSWEQAPERGRRWTPAAVVLALVLVASAVVGGQRLRDRSDGLTVTAPGTDTTGAGVGGRIGERETIEMDATVTAGDDSGALLPGAPPMTIAIADFGGRIETVETATGRRRDHLVFAEPQRLHPQQMHVVGDSLVLDVGNRVIRLPEAEGAEPQQLATNHRSVSTTDATSVWIHDVAAPRVGGAALRVDLGGGSVLDRVPLPALAQPLGGTAAGLVVSTPGTISYISNDGNARLLARGQGLVSDGINLARLDCLGNMSCGVVVGTVEDPDQTRVTLREGDVPVGAFGPAGGAFSPDGRWLALPLYRQLPSGGFDQPMVAVIDVQLGTEAGRMGGSPLTSPRTPLGWSPDSKWLAVSTGTGLQMWGTEPRRAIDLDVRFSPTYALAVR
jgi:hypothetical protein